MMKIGIDQIGFATSNYVLKLDHLAEERGIDPNKMCIRDRYKAIKEQMPAADDEVLAILLAINSLSTQLSREIEFDDKEKELESLRHKMLSELREKSANTGER